ncbi:putative FMNH2-dependent monooxygenase SfnC [Methylobacterium tardum]|uniref:SfnB family sulfur acquisition oxidoreductase n=1 Tax=Methylobacterium tardum TaxID=374432 RepID=A0AA37WVH1_9HYPH|nr:SfnB family sulfur acquisition oxidoreductase [Methylobacterium tardum]URD35879.1 SfnB family sulfur acquisition oxidoreductase [Methylobacterium tardum]GJE51888.1 putative FMNH2-dependent monooxygenase SfnC [Methylobacterium tardum]GLS72253.1 SfnB family sulfur acquisition oxidoreductase [Methylobacterium tardum]
MTLHRDDPAPEAAADRLPPPPSPPHRIRSDAEALAAARAVARVFAAGAAERDRDRRLPWAEIAAFTESGLGGITVPRAYGGAEVSYATLAEVFAILAEADGSAAQIPQNQFGVLALVAFAGRPDQKARIFRDVLAGYRIGNAGPARNGKAITHMETRLTAGPEGPRLTGTRFYATGALFAHWIPTRAVDPAGRPLVVFVRRDASGVRVVDDWQGFGQRTTASGTVVFEDAPVEADLTLDLAPLADRPGLFGPVSQLIQAAIDAGLARGATAAALAFLRTRTRPYPFTAETVAEDPHILGEIGRLTVDLHAAEEVLARAGRSLDRIAAAPVTAQSSAEASVAVAQAKILTTEVALEASERLLELAGASATREAYNLGRFWRDARVHTLHDPVRWKYHLLGNYALNGVLPARHQWN